MPREPHGKQFSLGTSAVYRIVVQGVIEKRLIDRLAGMELTATAGPESQHVSALVGRMQDQAQLIGVVNALYELRLPLLKVERLE